MRSRRRRGERRRGDEGVALEGEDSDRLVQGIDDPILADAGGGVVKGFLDRIAFRVVGADDLDDGGGG